MGWWDSIKDIIPTVAGAGIGGVLGGPGGAALGMGLGGAVTGAMSAKDSADAVGDAAKASSETSRYIFDRNTELNDPFYQVGKNALPGLAGWDAANPMPDYKSTVTDPMAAWNYQQSPAYQAKYSLGMGELNKQLQARGLSSSAMGGNRAADLSRRLTADDFNSERNYRTGQLTDLYKSKYSENADRYNRLLDQVKLGTGASTQMGAAGNQYASQIGQNNMATGEANASFYSGLGGLIPQATSTGLRTYDYGNRAGWWGQNATPTPDMGRDQIF